VGGKLASRIPNFIGRSSSRLWDWEMIEFEYGSMVQCHTNRMKLKSLRSDGRVFRGAPSLSSSPAKGFEPASSHVSIVGGLGGSLCEVIRVGFANLKVLTNHVWKGRREEIPNSRMHHDMYGENMA
jgi:hypothetical protein